MGLLGSAERKRAEPMACGSPVQGSGLGEGGNTSQVVANTGVGASAVSPKWEDLAGFRRPFGIPLVSNSPGLPSVETYSAHALLSVREVASRLRVTPSTIYKLCNEGKLAHCRVSNALRVVEESVAVYVNTRRR